MTIECCRLCWALLQLCLLLHEILPHLGVRISWHVVQEIGHLRLILCSLRAYSKQVAMGPFRLSTKLYWA